MVDANELRIGNWVKLGKQNTQVYQILYSIVTGQAINHADYKEEYFEPIPLTPEILIACGFYVDNSKAHIVYNESGNIYQLNLVNGVFESSYLGTPIYFLHELQNHYLANTRKELEIKL